MNIPSGLQLIREQATYARRHLSSSHCTTSMVFNRAVARSWRRRRVAPLEQAQILQAAPPLVYHPDKNVGGSTLWRQNCVKITQALNAKLAVKQQCSKGFPWFFRIHTWFPWLTYNVILCFINLLEIISFTAFQFKYWSLTCLPLGWSTQILSFNKRKGGANSTPYVSNRLVCHKQKENAFQLVNPHSEHDVLHAHGNRDTRNSFIRWIKWQADHHDEKSQSTSARFLGSAHFLSLFPHELAGDWHHLLVHCGVAADVGILRASPD
ncbi:hypothetical protein C8J57DRAFT_1246137 [Mycena rebaudengoi]|nr:hypothetical protein C8J57DRAFT_1246137 [Mycena rebaudengoi]